MVIRFACPEGHPLTASEDLIGKAGKCPKCDAKFLVPNPEEDESPAEESGNDPDKSASSESADAAPKSDDDEIIVFLCPNEHKLNGPKRMQGQAGQCPHCGAKFRIPSYDDEDEEAPELDAPELAEPEVMPTGAMLDQSELDGEITEVVEELADEIIEVVDDDLDPSMSGSFAPLPPPAAGESSMAAIFANLWRSKSPETHVYVYLEKGEVIEPSRYSPALSQRDYAVFAVDDEELSFRVVSVPWDSVSRVDFSRVEDLPDGLFI